MKAFVYTGILMRQRFRGYVVLNQRLVEQCVENLCHKGCRAVWSDIDALEAGEAVPEAKGLSRGEIRAVVRELKAVMSVYEGTCVPD